MWLLFYGADKNTYYDHDDDKSIIHILLLIYIWM